MRVAPRLLGSVIVVLGLGLTTPQDALAFDFEPNNSTASAKPLGRYLAGSGSGDDTTDQHDYLTFEGVEGTFEAWLTGFQPRGSSNDFELTLETATSTIATATEDTAAGYGKYLEATLSAGTTSYLHVQADSGGGRYRLRTRTHGQLPVPMSIRPPERVLSWSCPRTR